MILETLLLTYLHQVCICLKNERLFFSIWPAEKLMCNCIYFVIDGLNPASHHVPINVTLRRIAHGADAVAAQWDFDLLNGQGGWKSDGCRILLSDENITTIQCYSLSNYAVLMV